MRLKILIFFFWSFLSFSLCAQTSSLSFFNCVSSYLTMGGNKLYLKNTIKPNQMIDGKKRIWNLAVTETCSAYPALRNAWVKIGPLNEILYLRLEFTPNKGEIVGQFDARSQLAIFAQINRSVEKVAFLPFRVNNQISIPLTYVVALKKEQYFEAVTYGAIANAETDN